MQGKKVVAAVSSLVIGVTAVFSCVPFSVQAEEGKVPEVVQEAIEEIRGEEGEALEDISVNQEHFPDELFRRYVRKYFDRDKDGKLSISEISDTTDIEIHYTNITCCAR